MAGRGRRQREGRATEWLVAAGLGFILGAFAMALITVEPRTVDRVAATVDGMRDRSAIAREERREPATLPVVDAPPVLEPTDDAEPADGTPTSAASPAADPSPEALAGRGLRIPVRGVVPGDLVPSFDDPRGRNRRHEAIDILAPRGTPVVAVEAGRIARLFASENGGITIYQYDPGEDYVYYYAHLDAYADGLADGDDVRAGQVLGYVGTTGNAPPDVPHLHFAIMQLDAERRWWDGTPIDPYPLLAAAASR